MTNEKVVRKFVLIKKHYEIFPLAAIFGTPIHAPEGDTPFSGEALLVGEGRNFEIEISASSPQYMLPPNKGEPPLGHIWGRQIWPPGEKFHNVF